MREKKLSTVLRMGLGGVGDTQDAVMCEILKELRINAGALHTVIPSQVDPRWSWCMVFSSLSFPSNPLSFP